jgi:hypothetical protein
MVRRLVEADIDHGQQFILMGGWGSEYLYQRWAKVERFVTCYKAVPSETAHLTTRYRIKD